MKLINIKHVNLKPISMGVLAGRMGKGLPSPWNLVKHCNFRKNTLKSRSGSENKYGISIFASWKIFCNLPCLTEDSKIMIA